MSVHRWLLLAAASTLVVTAQAAAPASTGADARDALAATDTWGPIHTFERSPLGESMVADARGVAATAGTRPERALTSVKVGRG